VELEEDMSQRLDFIDVSHYQVDAGPIDWKKVAAAGVLGVIAKCTEGTGSKDPTYETNRAGALGAGLAFASYHFLRHGNVAAQMDFYIDVCGPDVGERVVIDYEHTDCTISDLEQAVDWLCDNRPDLEIAIYGASKLTDDSKASTTGILKGTSLWAARYSSKEPVINTAIWPVWTAWQFSQEGRVDGIKGAVDTNTFNGSRSNCLKWFGPVGAEPEPEPEPPPATQTTIYKVTVTAPVGDVSIQVEEITDEG
jgi:lysozyme